MGKAWVITAEMGYGHQRAVHPFGDMAEGGIISLGSDPSTPLSERRLWKRLLRIYELLSRLKRLPVMGGLLFKVIDSLLSIPPWYPLQQRSAPSLQVRILKQLIRWGLCRGVLSKIRQQPLPVVTSFYASAVAADLANITPLYCIICDADLGRAWVASEPARSKIEYCVPCGRAAKRLKSYGVPRERIHLSGFPLPESLIGGLDMPVLKQDLGQRLHYLDPQERFLRHHGFVMEKFLGREHCVFRNDRCLTLSFAVGGAGAQQDIGRIITERLHDHILAGRIRLNLVAGIRPEVQDFFLRLKARQLPGVDGLRIVGGNSLSEYFDNFNVAMRQTDILWTKPSELSFYCALGIPIIMAPAIGPQERFNRKWLFEIQAGMDQENPACVDEWLFDLLKYGRLADAAWAGFLKARKMGTYHIRELVSGGKIGWEDFPQ